MKRWLFTLHKSVALLISLLTSENARSDNWKLQNRGDSLGLRGHPSTIFTNIPSPVDPNKSRQNFQNQPSFERRNTFDASNERPNILTPQSSDINFTRQISIDPEASIIRSQQALGRYSQASMSYHSSGNYMNSIAINSSPSYYQSSSPLSRSPGIPIINSIQRSHSNSVKLAGSYTGRENERTLDSVMLAQSNYVNAISPADIGVSVTPSSNADTLQSRGDG